MHPLALVAAVLKHAVGASRTGTPGLVRLMRGVVLTLILIAMPHAPQAMASERSDTPVVSALIEMLSSRAKAQRRSAADLILSRGLIPLELAARRTASLDDEEWSDFAAACIGHSWKPDAVALVAGSHGAPEAHRARLIEVAHKIDPRAGTTAPPSVLEAAVRRIVIEESGVESDSFIGAEVAIHGHDAVRPVLSILRVSGDPAVDPARCAAILEYAVQEEDLSELSELLLSGRTAVAPAIARLDEIGCPGALDALTEGVRRGAFDELMAGALARASDPARAVMSVRAWMKSLGRELVAEERRRVAWVFADLRATSESGVVESWAADARDPDLVLSLAAALSMLGCASGVDTLSGALDGRTEAGIEFDASRRWHAVSLLRRVVDRLARVEGADARATTARSVRTVLGDRSRPIDDVARVFHDWWSEVRQRIRYDARRNEWRFDRK